LRELAKERPFARNNARTAKGLINRGAVRNMRWAACNNGGRPDKVSMALTPVHNIMRL
jgi:hypothetical protein